MKRFLKYAAVTLPTFSFDLALLFVLVHFLSFHYLPAAIIAFVAATTANYILSRRFVFVGTNRPVASGYIYFLSIATLGVGLVASSMWVLVGLLHLNYIASRICVALAEGTWNYLMNLRFNFRLD